MFRRLLSGLAVLGTAVATAAIMSSSSDKQESNKSLKEEKTDSKAETSDSENDVAEGTEADSSKLFGMFGKDFGANALEQLKKLMPDFTKQPKVLDDLSLEGVAKFIKENKAKKIIVMTGAGVSTSAGIPDFRSPGTGLYHNLQKYNLPHPQAIFEIDYFRTNPEPFFALAKELFPSKLKPTICHYFVRLLHDNGLLLRVYTQNIDSLDHIAGVPAEKIVEAHGSFYTNHCTNCSKEFSLDWMKEKVETVSVPRCTAEECDGVVKPDVVFFGESLPSKFFSSMKNDFPECDLLIIMGTSLVVQPFASLIDRVGPKVPRLLINMEKAGARHGFEKFLGMPGLDFDDESNYRDVFWKGTCDDGCELFAKYLEWDQHLKEIKDNGWKKIDEEYETQQLSENLKRNLNVTNEGKSTDSTKPKM